MSALIALTSSLTLLALSAAVAGDYPSWRLVDPPHTPMGDWLRMSWWDAERSRIGGAA